MDDPTSKGFRDTMKGKCQIWLKFSDFAGSLEDAFKLWDAVRSDCVLASTCCTDN